MSKNVNVALEVPLSVDPGDFDMSCRCVKKNTMSNINLYMYLYIGRLSDAILVMKV